MIKKVFVITSERLRLLVLKSGYFLRRCAPASGPCALVPVTRSWLAVHGSHDREGGPDRAGDRDRRDRGPEGGGLHRVRGTAARRGHELGGELRDHRVLRLRHQPGGQAWADFDVYMPERWADGHAPPPQAGIPDDLEFATKPQLAISAAGTAGRGGAAAAVGRRPTKCTAAAASCGEACRDEARIASVFIVPCNFTDRHPGWHRHRPPETPSRTRSSNGGPAATARRALATATGRWRRPRTRGSTC